MRNTLDFAPLWPSFQDGLLVIDLVRQVPEVMKPRRIEIGAAQQIKQAA